MNITNYEYLTELQKQQIGEILLNLADRGASPDHITNIRNVLVKELGSLNYKPVLH
jgi:hypothetical protein